MAFYGNMERTAARLLEKFKRGDVVLIRRTLTPPANPWDDPVVTETSETLDAVVTGIDARLIGTPASEGGPVLLSSDRVVICTPPVSYEPNDVVTIDGKAVTVLRVDNVLAAGGALVAKLYVRG